MANTRDKDKNKTKKIKKTEEKVVKKEDKKEARSNKNKNDNKKTILIIAVLIIFFIGIFVVSNNSGKGKYGESSGSLSTGDAQSESANIKEEEMGELTNIGIEEYLALYKGENASIIYIGRPTCSHCVIQQPIMRYMVYKYGVQVNYLNTDELDEKGITKLQKSDDYFSEGFGTPLILVVKGSEIVDMSEGETSIEDLTDMFKKQNLITEE